MGYYYMGEWIRKGKSVEYVIHTLPTKKQSL